MQCHTRHHHMSHKMANDEHSLVVRGCEKGDSADIAAKKSAVFAEVNGLADMGC